MSKVKIVETILRDAHQSLVATRMSTADMLPVLEKLDNVGYYALEMWGGATFDSCLRFLNENPWQRLRDIKKVVKNTKLQMLFRGQNILGYKHYPDDVLEEFIKKSVYNGIEVIRIFDALNDIRNMQKAIEISKREGAHVQASFCYTTSPVHSIEYFVKLAKELSELGADSICIKDMSGLLLPFSSEELVKELKKNVDIPIDLHSHMTSGVASMSYIKAIEAGVDIVDTALSPLSMGTSQPCTESLAISLKGHPRDPELNIDLLLELQEHFQALRQKYFKEGLLSEKVMGVNIKSLWYQVPGGMLSNLVNQLKLMDKLDIFEKVLEEIPNVRKDLGYPPLVTPMSQMVGTQALFNIMAQNKYQMIPNEIKDYIAGWYGKAPGEISEKLLALMENDSREVITCRPADKIEPGLQKARQEHPELNEEDLLSYLLFPQIALDYFKKR